MEVPADSDCTCTCLIPAMSAPPFRERYLDDSWRQVLKVTLTNDLIASNEVDLFGHSYAGGNDTYDLHYFS